MRGKYHASNRNHQTSNKTTTRVKDRRDSFARKPSLTRGELHTGSSSPIKKPASTADPSPVRPALLYPSAMIQSTAMSATRTSRMYRVEDESM